MKAIYEVTIEVLKEHAVQWLTWMKDIHIPDVLKTGIFTQAEIARIIDPIHEAFECFRIMYYADSVEAIEHYRAELSPALQKHHNELFGQCTKGSRKVLLQEKDFFDLVS